MLPSMVLPDFFLTLSNEPEGFILKNIRPLFYLTWLILNLLLAGQTGLLDDEAYYWVYSRFPDWGYYDHPPMIAMLIKAGYAIFPERIWCAAIYCADEYGHTW